MVQNSRDSTPLHPKGIQTRILLTSVFGPYAQDDEYGSRAIYPMELYHNQVTRAQGSFSLRMFYRSWGLMLIQQNISAPSTLLDFPTLETFERELTAHHYDIVGISGIISKLGQGAGDVPAGPAAVAADGDRSWWTCRGDSRSRAHDRCQSHRAPRGRGVDASVSWRDPHSPIVHPEILSSFGFRVLGMRVPDNTRDTAATIIPSVGCPTGCNFCTTSAFFGGKGKRHHFYKSGDTLFDVIRHMAESMGVQSFFVMDENLLNRPRAMQLLRRMEEHGKSWALYVFSSINAICGYSMDELLRLGILWIWVGLDSPQLSYAKLKNARVRARFAHEAHKLRTTYIAA